MDEARKAKLKKLISALLLICLCAAVFIVFMRKREDIPAGVVPTALPKMTDASQDEGLPYVLDIMLALDAGGLGCEISEPVENGNLTKYELVFKQHTDSGFIELKTDQNGRVVSCMLNRRYLYAGKPTVSGVVGDALRAEYERRLAADKRLLSAFLPITVSKLDFASDISASKLNAMLDKLLEAYEKQESLFAAEKPIVLIVDSKHDDIYTNFSAVIMLMDALGK